MRTTHLLHVWHALERSEREGNLYRRCPLPNLNKVSYGIKVPVMTELSQDKPCPLVIYFLDGILIRGNYINSMFCSHGREVHVFLSE